MNLIYDVNAAEVVREDSFAGAQWSAAGPGPGQVADTPWVVRAFDSHDDKMIHESGEKAGGLHLVRGVAWGLPGAIVSYVGERAGEGVTHDDQDPGPFRLGEGNVHEVLVQKALLCWSVDMVAASVPRGKEETSSIPAGT